MNGYLKIGATLSLAVAATSTPLCAEDSRVFGDEAIWDSATKTFMLQRAAKESLYAEPELHARIRRVGLFAACPIVETAISNSAGELEEEFRNIFLSAARKTRSGKIRQDELYQLAGKYGWYLSIQKTLEKNSPGIFETAIQKSLRSAVSNLKGMANGPIEWRGDFSNWNFEKKPRLAYKIACMLVTQRNYKIARVPFDGFFIDEPTQ